LEPSWSWTTATGSDGPIEPLLKDPTVTDILINTHRVCFVERFGKLYETKVHFKDEAHLLRIIGKIVAGVGRRIDVTLPLDSTHHCRQPILLTNPGSGRKALYVASQNSMWIEDMPRDESEALLQRLFEIAEDPAIIYEHVWRVGDLIMWDNLACLHARTDWPSEQRRTLRRCTVEGEPLY